MATESKLKEDIKKLETAINGKAPEKLKAKFKNQLSILKAELSALQKPATSKMSRAKQLKAKYKALYGVRFQGIDIEKDADIPAMRNGRRVSQGIKGNQYASKKQAKGNVYYEYRENRIDMKQPSKKYPKLEDGGMMAKGGYVAVGEKDGYWTIMSKPTTKEQAQKQIDMGVPRGEVGKVVSLEEAKSHKKVIGREYLEHGGMMAKEGSTKKFLIDDIVYNKITKTIGIVRVEDSRGETKTDADGNVNTSELQHYNTFKYPKQKDAKVAPSTSKEIEDRGLFNPFKKREMGGYMADGGKTQGYDDREDERLAMKYGRMKSKDLDSTRSRRDDARFEERMDDGGMMAKGGKIEEGNIVMVIPEKLKAEVTNIGKDFVTVEFINRRPDGGDKRGTYKINEVKKSMADGGMMADGGEVGKGFLIRDMNQKLNRMFPDTFGFTVGNVSKEGNKTLNSSALIVDLNDPFRGLEDKDIQSKLFFPQYKRDHNINFRVMQGGENTYFYFALESEKGDEYIGQFGFKDSGNVPSNYITKFIAFLMEQYGLPFDVKHSVMAKGGMMADGGMMAEGGAVNEDNMEMVVSQIKAIKHHAEELSKIITSSTPIEAWVVAKIERSETDLSDVTHYLDGLKMEHGGRVSSSQHRLNR